MTVRPKKRLGQHFLIDPNVIGKIVDAIGAPPDATLVEIGPGMGALTGRLLERHPQVQAVEVDAEAVAHLRDNFPGLDVKHEDILSFDWRGLDKAYVVGNLPYYITSPILFSLLDARMHLIRAVLMMQREVAERIVAGPGTKAYGILSVQTQLLSQPKWQFPVSRSVFRPQPKVDSAVISLEFNTGEELGFDVRQMKRVVRTAFGQRRKMLRKSLADLCQELDVGVPEEFSTHRPEALSPSDFVSLTNALFRKDD